jgi:hypothetical protein
MIPVRARILLLSLAGLAAYLFYSPAVSSCPFCSQEKTPTLASDYNTAQMVFVGAFSNGNLAANTTDFTISKVLKSHEFLKGKKVITLPRYIPPTKNQFLVFCDIFKDKPDPYRGIELQPGSQLPEYLAGAVALKDRPMGERLRYCFDFLNCPELEVALDAYREFAKADYKDYREIARKLPAATLAKWLQDPKTPPYRYGLYGSLIGHCGTPEHAKLLRQMIDDPEKRKGSGIDGLLFGYVQLAPKEAYAYLTSTLKDANEEFLMRYACLRTFRFLWDLRPDIISRKEIVAGVAVALDQGDMADFAIEDLRKWQRWEMTDKILDLFNRKTHSVPVIRRAILRYALRCPDPRAAAFVQEQRRRDADWVRDAEEILNLEYPDAPVAGKKSNGPNQQK